MTVPLDRNAINSKYEDSEGLIGSVPNGFLVDDKDGSVLTPADINEEQFSRYMRQAFGPGPRPGDAALAPPDDFVPFVISQVFNTPANTTLALALVDIIAHMDADAANIPRRVGSDVESPVDTTSGVTWVILNAFRASRGLKIPEEVNDAFGNVQAPAGPPGSGSGSFS